MIGKPRLNSPAGYVVFGIVLYLAFLIVTAPAALLVKAAASFSDGVQLSQPRGTLWHGSAQLHAGTSVTGVRDLGRLDWSLRPWWLFLGRAQLGVHLDGGLVRGQAQIGVSRRRFALEGLEASLPAGLVSLIYGPAAFFEPTGTIDVAAPKAELTSNGLNANIEAQWRGAGGRFTGPATLGDYQIKITGNGPNAAISLSTLRGNLDLSGQGTWNVAGDGAIHFTGRAQPRADHAEQLEPLLRALGRDLGGGQRQIRFNARIPLVQLLGL